MNQEKNPNNVDCSAVDLNRHDLDGTDTHLNPGKAYKDAWQRQQIGVPTYGDVDAERDFFNIWTGQGPQGSSAVLTITDVATLRDFESGTDPENLMTAVQKKIHLDEEVITGLTVCRLHILDKLTDEELECLCSYMTSHGEDQIRKINARTV